MGTGLGSQSAAIAQAQLIDRLIEMGVLPSDAPQEKLESLAQEIATELRASLDSLSGLGKTNTGSRAVDDSAYLARLIQNAETAAIQKGNHVDEKQARQDALLALFSRRIGERVFHLRAGYWTDSDYKPKSMQKRVQEIEAYSDSYFELAVKTPSIAPCLALSDRILVVVDGTPIRVSPPTPEPVKDAEQLKDAEQDPQVKEELRD